MNASLTSSLRCYLVMPCCSFVTEKGLSSLCCRLLMVANVSDSLLIWRLWLLSAVEDSMVVYQDKAGETVSPRERSVLFIILCRQHL